MVSVKFLISTTAAVMVSTAAFAADMPQPLPPQPYQPQLMVMAQPEGAWYLRGDIGVGIMSRSQRGVSAKSAQQQQLFHQPLVDGRHHVLHGRHRL